MLGKVGGVREQSDAIRALACALRESQQAGKNACTERNNGPCPDHGRLGRGFVLPQGAENYHDFAPIAIGRR